jgi:hypothetical protein
MVLSGLLAICGVIALVVMGGIAGFVGASDRSDGPMAGPIVGIIGVCIFLVMLLIALPGLIGGYFLMQYKPWARILIIVLSALDLLNVPIGTALGIYGFWVLLKPETEQLFTGRPAPLAPQI